MLHFVALEPIGKHLVSERIDFELFHGLNPLALRLVRGGPKAVKTRLLAQPGPPTFMSLARCRLGWS